MYPAALLVTQPPWLIPIGMAGSDDTAYVERFTARALVRTDVYPPNWYPVDGEFVEPAELARDTHVDDIASVENTIFSIFAAVVPFHPRNPSIDDENDENHTFHAAAKFHVADIDSFEKLSLFQYSW